MHHKLMVFGLVLVLVVVAGFIFLDKLTMNQQEIANTPLSSDVDSSQQSKAQAQKNENTADMSAEDDYEDMEKDLNSTDTNVDSDNAQLQSEVSGL